MLHARMIRPTVAGAVPVAVDEASIRDIPGTKAVWIKDFLAVVAEKEWNAVRAAQAPEGDLVAVETQLPRPRQIVRSLLAFDLEWLNCRIADQLSCGINAAKASTVIGVDIPPLERDECNARFRTPDAGRNIC
jgi:hypothetical protein